MGLMSMGKFSTLASLNCIIFVVGSQRVVLSGRGTMDSIMALKVHFGFKFVHDNRFPRKSKMFCF